MYTDAFDATFASWVAVKSGDPCTDADYERVRRSLLRLAAPVHPDEVARMILVIDPGQPPPSAAWRQRLAAARPQVRPFRFAIVTSSEAEKRAVTAINWARPPRPGQKIMVHATFSHAVAWMDAECGRPAGPTMGLLHARARAEAGARVVRASRQTPAVKRAAAL